MADKEKKVIAQLDDDMLGQVAGGFSQEHWEAMTPEERLAAYRESQAIKTADGNAYCAFYDLNA